MAYIDPILFLWLKYILFTSERFPGFSIFHLDNHLCYENENTGKGYIFYTKYEIYPKIWLELANVDTVFGEKACTYHYHKEKIEIGSIISELNPELWKTGVLP